jgi:hypothetical protein
VDFELHISTPVKMVEISTKTYFLIFSLLLIVYGLFEFFRAAIRVRKFYRGAPGLAHDPIWGHMKSMNDYMKVNISSLSQYTVFAKWIAIE